MMENVQENDIKLIEEAVFRFPHLLKTITSPSIIKGINNLFPYSHGIEFECFMKDIYAEYYENYFNSIPNIMDVNVDRNEQRYRIPSGLTGLICLYEICENMKKYSIVDLASSNHYHTDMTDVKELTHWNTNNLNYQEFQNDNECWIIDELKTWNSYRNTSKAYLGCWYKYNELGTLEIRIGEPTFEYSIIAKRLMQCSQIVTKLKQNLDVNQNHINKLKGELESLKEKDIIVQEEESEMERIINQRKKKI